MKKLTQADFRIMPWKNGQGSTRELLIEPSSASLDDFDWRVSCADIRADGAFSSFRGVDRSLLLLSGVGVALDVNNQVTFTLTKDSSALPFAGEDEVYARLLDGAVLDFNVMTRRKRWTHDLQKYTFKDSLSIDLKTDVTLIYHAEGSELACSHGQECVSLRQTELLMYSSDNLIPSNILIKTSGEVTIYVVSLKRRQGSL